MNEGEKQSNEITVSHLGGVFLFFRKIKIPVAHLCVKFAAHTILCAVTQTAESCLDLLDLLEKKIIHQENVWYEMKHAVNQISVMLTFK